MYQHDLSEAALTQRLSEVIEECVNGGGVDINACGAHLLQYVAGMNAPRAKASAHYHIHLTTYNLCAYLYVCI